MNNNFKSSTRSHIGGREENQDAASWSETGFGFLFVVCDGMGGAAGGKEAAELAVNTVIENAKNPTSNDAVFEIRSAIENANFKIFNKAHSDDKLKGMGTTITVLLLQPDRALMFHLGDSRIYHFRNNKILFKTFDHSRVFEMIRKGILTEEEAATHPDSNIITRALGVNEFIEIDFQETDYEKGDRFILCTDGVCGVMDDNKILGYVSSIDDIFKLTTTIIEDVNELGIKSGGKHDNFTLTVVEMKTNSRIKKPPVTRPNALLLITGLFFISVIILLFFKLPAIKFTTLKQDSSKSHYFDSAFIKKTDTSIFFEPFKLNYQPLKTPSLLKAVNADAQFKTLQGLFANCYKLRESLNNRQLNKTPGLDEQIKNYNISAFKYNRSIDTLNAILNQYQDSISGFNQLIGQNSRKVNEAQESFFSKVFPWLSDKKRNTNEKNTIPKSSGTTKNSNSSPVTTVPATSSDNSSGNEPQDKNIEPNDPTKNVPDAAKRVTEIIDAGKENVRSLNKEQTSSNEKETSKSKDNLKSLIQAESYCSFSGKESLKFETMPEDFNKIMHSEKIINVIFENSKPPITEGDDFFDRIFEISLKNNEKMQLVHVNVNKYFLVYQSGDITQYIYLSVSDSEKTHLSIILNDSITVFSLNHPQNTTAFNYRPDVKGILKERQIDFSNKLPGIAIASMIEINPKSNYKGNIYSFSIFNIDDLKIAEKGLEQYKVRIKEIYFSTDIESNIEKDKLPYLFLFENGINTFNNNGKNKDVKLIKITQNSKIK